MDVQSKKIKWNEMRDSIDSVYSSGKAMKRLYGVYTIPHLIPFYLQEKR